VAWTQTPSGEFHGIGGSDFAAHMCRLRARILALVLLTNTSGDGDTVDALLDRAVQAVLADGPPGAWLIASRCLPVPRWAATLRRSPSERAGQRSRPRSRQEGRTSEAVSTWDRKITYRREDSVHRRTTVFVVLLVLATLLGPIRAVARDTTPVGTPAALPTTPVGEQLAWVLGVLNDGARSLTPADVTARFAPAFLAAAPPEMAIGLTQQVAVAYGPFALQGFTRPPTATQANALVTGGVGTPLVVPISVEAADPHRITGLNFVPVPPPPGIRLVPVAGADGTPAAGSDRLDGLFDVGDGRRFYLSCSGSGGPTVVLESGHNDSAATWFAVESAVAGFARVCSYDRANAVAGASDPAPTPRPAAEAVADLHALLAAAAIPGPYVLVGPSLGGPFVRLYSHTYPDEVVGLVLVDASHEEQNARLEALVSPEL
jgi:hypothetical protein